MSLVQIEESELATLRRERDEAKRQSDELANANRTLTTKCEQAEAAQKKAEDEKAEATQKVKNLEDEKARASLKDQRMNALGSGFMAKLGDTSKARLTELASTCSDEQWDAELREREEWAGVKRDAQAQGGTPAGGNGGGDTPSNEQTGFKNEEVASFMRSGVASNSTGGSGGGTPAQDGATSVRQLARSFAPRKTSAKA